MIFKSELKTPYEAMSENRFARKRLAAGDASFEKFTHPKERAHVHHH